MATPERSMHDGMKTCFTHVIGNTLVAFDTSRDSSKGHGVFMGNKTSLCKHARHTKARARGAQRLR